MTQKNNVSRRSFVKAVAAGAGAASVPASLTGCIGDDKDDNKKDLTVFVFGHGVASGDPLSDRVIIWTRITPDKNAGAVATAEWRVATDEAMRNVVKSGRVDTDANKDYTIKIDVTGLDANTTYYYQFEGSGNTKSVVGKTKTLPVGDVSAVKMAVCSCANFPFGNFHVYKDIAKSGADVVVHLGDYIYEYEHAYYPTTPVDKRKLQLEKETITLSDYRSRYAQYRVDTDLQAAHQNAPFICVWDDHEVANDSFKDGAQNHTEGTGTGGEGKFTERRAAAIQAYHEWLPIRTGADRLKIDRSFDFGNLVSLHMADTRLVARDKPLSFSNYDFNKLADLQKLSEDIREDGPRYKDKAARTMLGTEQENRLFARMFDSGATWQVLGQQVLMGRILIPQELLKELNVLQQTLETNPNADVSATQGKILNAINQLVDIKKKAAQGQALTKQESDRISTVAPYNLDAWDGYAKSREGILQRMAPSDVGRSDGAKLAGRNKNLVVLAGDTHNAWASNLYPLDDNANVDRTKSVGVEFATASVTSPGFDQYLKLGDKQPLFENAIQALVDDLQYLNAGDRGYMFVEFAKAEASCEWRFVTDVTKADGFAINAARTKKMKVQAGEGNRKLIPA